MNRILSLLLLALVGLTSVPQPSSAAGIVVVSSDEWPVSQQGFVDHPASTQRFVQNLATLFAPGGSGNFLAYSLDFSLTGGCCLGGFGASGTALNDTIVGAGHSWTVTTAIPFNLPTLLAYDAVFLTGSTDRITIPGCGLTAAAPVCGYPDNQVLIDYVNAGGNVFLQGGNEWDREDERTVWGAFLNAFGLGFEGGPGLNGFSGDANVGAQSYGYSLFDGVTLLTVKNGNWVTLEGPPNSAARLFTLGGDGLFGVYDPSFVSQVPEPGTIAILGIVLAATVRARHRTKSAHDT